MRPNSPILVALPYIGIGLAWAMNMTVIPMLAATHTNTSARIGLLVAMGALSGVWVPVLVGAVSDRTRSRLGRRRPFLIGGTALAALTLCLLPYAPSYPWLLAVATVFYVCEQALLTAAQSLISEAVEPHHLGLCNGLARVFTIVGYGLTFAGSPRLWNLRRSAPFFAAAAVQSISVLGSVGSVREDSSRYEAPPALSFDFLKYPSFVRLNVVVFFSHLAYGFLNNFVIRYCKEALGISETDSGTAMLMLVVGGAVLGYPVGRLSDRISRRTVLLAGLLIYSLALALGWFATTTAGLYVVCTVLGVGYIAVQISLYALLADVTPRSRTGEFTGIMNLFVNLPQVIGMLAMGALLDRVGYGLFFTLPLVATLCAFLVTLGSQFRADGTRPADSPSPAPGAKA